MPDDADATAFDERGMTVPGNGVFHSGVRRRLFRVIPL
jgi:hypothetical protein